MCGPIIMLIALAVMVVGFLFNIAWMGYAAVILVCVGGAVTFITAWRGP